LIYPCLFLLMLLSTNAKQWLWLWGVRL
jgi:hypothetical protein